MNLDNDGTEYESTLVKRRPNDSEFLDLDTKIDKSGIEEVSEFLDLDTKIDKSGIEEVKTLSKRLAKITNHT